MSRNFLIVANPFSGTGKASKALMLLKKRLGEEYFFYDVFIAPISSNLPEYIKDHLSADTTDVVAIGGDGTLNAVLNAIHDKDFVLNIIPTGTGNDFIKTIDIGGSLSEQIETIINGNEKIVDFGDCNGKKFINGVGIGFDGQIIHDFSHNKNILRGHAKYYYYMLKVLGSYKPRMFRYELDGEKFEKNLNIMAIHNGTTFGGGFLLNPDGKVDDQLLSICTIGNMPGWKRFFHIWKASFGAHGSLSIVDFHTVKHLKIEACEKTTYAHIDGEYLGQPPFEIRIVEKALKVRVKSSS